MSCRSFYDPFMAKKLKAYDFSMKDQQFRVQSLYAGDWFLTRVDNIVVNINPHNGTPSAERVESIEGSLH